MQRICTIILLFILALTVQGQERSYVCDSNYPFIVITHDTTTAVPTFSDEEFYRLSRGVVFRTNRAEIPADDAFLNLYREEVLPYINRNHLQLRKIFVRGAASPEGSYQNNNRLGKARSQALIDALRRDLRYQYLKADTEVSSVTEDYGYLCLLMKEAADPDYKLVQQLYDECEGDELCCKQKLMKAQGGKLWKRLLQQYFPRLRTARLVLWFSLPDEAHAPAFPIKAVEQPLVLPRQHHLAIQPCDTLPVYSIVEPRRHLLALRTNLVHDLFYMPQFGWAPSGNIQLEFYLKKGHLTYNLGFTWGNIRRWNHHEFYQVRDFQFELRRYFKPGLWHTGFYLGAVAEAIVYGIGLDAKRGWEGEGAALSLSGGYVMALNKKKNLRLEFSLAAGFLYSLFDPYVYGNPITGQEDGDYYYNYLGSATSFKKRNHRFTWLGPTNAGIQLTYDIVYHKRKNK